MDGFGVWMTCPHVSYKELQAKCRERRLRVSGRAAKLIARLMAGTELPQGRQQPFQCRSFLRMEYFFWIIVVLTFPRNT